MQSRSDQNAEYYIEGILQKDRIILSKAITLVESTRKEDEALASAVVQACLQQQKFSRRIAVSGAPGAGKSTFLNAFGKQLSQSGNSLAILAIDPSSTISKGSILGDKTRMDAIVNEENVFIRPTASSNSLGGVARNTRESILLCEAFGFDYIFVETVGVGQSETMVRNMTDLFLLLLLPNAGDELQGIKRGIMEMADIILINKSDKENSQAARTAAAQVRHALHLFAASEKDWITRVLNISSLEGSGLDAVQQEIDAYFLRLQHSGYLEHQRAQQQLQWMEDSIANFLSEKMNRNAQWMAMKKEMEEKIRRREIDPNEAARILAEHLFSSGN